MLRALHYCYRLLMWARCDYCDRRSFGGRVARGVNGRRFCRDCY